MARSRRVRISRVRQAALVASVVSLAAVPLGLVALDGGADGKAPRTPIARTPVVASREKPTTKRAAAPQPSAQAVDLNRAAVERVRGLTSPELVELVRKGQSLERLAAVHTLWVRGEKAAVEALVDESGSRELSAKLTALRASVK